MSGNGGTAAKAKLVELREMVLSESQRISLKEILLVILDYLIEH